MPAVVHVWWSKNNSVQSVLFSAFRWFRGLNSGRRVFREVLDPLNCLAGPLFLIVLSSTSEKGGGCQETSL